jgi:general secretion pathway protein F
MASLTLDNLIALNGEIAALVRAGVPLEQGLADLADDLPGPVGNVAAELAQKTSRGEPLDQSIAELSGRMPPAYRAVIQAGVRAGRLPAALEAIAASARRINETYRGVVVAVSYPLLVFALVWGGLAYFCGALAPGLADSFRAMDLPGQRFLGVLGWLGRWAVFWGPLVPALFLLLVVAWWRACTRAATLHGRRSVWLFGGLPWMGSLLRWSRTATFLDVLGLLVENQTPLSEALFLASQAAGDAKTSQAARKLAEAIDRGQTQPDLRGSAFPPLMNWLMLAARRDGSLVPALEHSAAVYHRRARCQADFLRILLPVFLTGIFAGGLTAAYAMVVFLPYIAMLHRLAR